MLNSLSPYRNYLLKTGKDTTINYVKRFHSYCIAHNKDYSNISAEDMKEFFIQLQTEITKKSFLTAKVELKVFFDYLLTTGLCEKEGYISALKGFRVPYTQERPVVDSLSEKTILNIIDKGAHCIKTLSETKVKSCVLLLFYSGISRAKFLNLKRHQIDLENCRITLDKYIYFFPKTLVPILKTYFQEEDEQDNAFNLHTSTLNTIFTQLDAFNPKQRQRLKVELLIASFRQLVAKRRMDVRYMKQILHLTPYTWQDYYTDLPISVLEKQYHKKFHPKLE